MPHQRSRALASWTVAVLVFVACGSPPSLPPASPTATTTQTALPLASGRPFVAGSWPTTGSAPCGEQSYTGELARIAAPDAHTVVFELCRPDVAFLSKIAVPALSIDDAASLQLGATVLGRTPNGAGPYMVSNWVAGEAIMMVPNPRYAGPTKASTSLLISWSPEPAQRVLELRSGTVDGIDAGDSADINSVETDPGLRLIRRHGLTTLALAMNNTFRPYDDERVRQAIAMGIDRQHLVGLMGASSELATHVTPCVILGGCEGAAWYDNDIPQAKQLLAAAGYANGFKTTIHVDDAAHPYLPNQAAVLAEVVRELKANLNVDATVDSSTAATYAQKAAGGKLDGIHVAGVAASYPDATQFLDPFLGATSSRELGTRYAGVAAALAAAASTDDQAARRSAYKQVNELIRAHVPLVPISHTGSIVAFRSDVEGAHASPLGAETFATMKPTGRPQLVFMQATEPASLFCADEPSVAVQRACAQFGEPLYAYRQEQATPEPALATGCAPDKALKTWTCTLRDGITFANGSAVDAGDVVLTFAAQWDVKHPLHKGRTSDFAVFSALFGGFLNPKPTL